MWRRRVDDGRIARTVVMLFAALVASGLGEGTSRANLRAPRTVAWLPSTAPSAVEELAVRHEDLVFTCETQQCKVVATYFVVSRRSLEVELRFVAPVPALTTARVGNAAGQVSFARAPALKAVLEKNISLNYPEADRPPIYEATVKLPITTGENTLTFEYVQPLGAQEEDYGYFRQKGRMVQRFAYGLWPLREWRRARDFKIDVTVTIPRTPPTRWQRWFGKSKTIQCGAGGRLPELPADLKPSREQRGNVFCYRGEIAGGIPTEFSCEIGDDDLVN